MSKFEIKIDSILGGISPNLYRGGRGQFATSIGIDPDMPVDQNTAIKTSGVLVPSSYTDFSGAALTSAINWIITNTKNDNIYVLCTNGRFLSYSVALSAASEALVGTISPAGGNGMAYYNNYIYLVGTTDISRYGPLSETAALTNNVWTGATLGTQIALGNATYPTLRGIVLPNHPMHVHVDGKLYVGDFSLAAEANRGRGLIHWIQTKRVTDEGDTNNGTTRSALILPWGYAPTDIESWGNDLVISAIQVGGANTAGTAIDASNTIVQGKAALFFWDPINAPALPYRMVPLIDPLVTALLNHNGQLWVWSGNGNNGVRLSRYLGGYSLKQEAFFEEGVAAYPGCVDGLGNKIVWGAFTTYPGNSASVYALGYKDANLPMALHNIINTGATDTANAIMVTAIKMAQHASSIAPRFVVAWKDKDSSTTAANFGIDKLGSSARAATFRSLTYSVGKPFRINKISIQLGAAVDGATIITPTVRVDDDSTTITLTVINNTNYTGSQRRIVLYPAIYGSNNFNLQLAWTGTGMIPVTFPIIIEGEILEDATL